LSTFSGKLSVLSGKLSGIIKYFEWNIEYFGWNIQLKKVLKICIKIDILCTLNNVS